MLLEGDLVLEMHFDKLSAMAMRIEVARGLSQCVALKFGSRGKSRIGN